MQSTHLIEHANEFRHIRSLYAKRAKNDENSSTLAQTLETNILTAFKGEHKFIFELLQNADDVAKQDEILEVSFVLKKISFNGRYYLIFSHSGMHFTAEDVEKICDNGQQYLQEKSRATQKIGYKGIGFKAVFSIADCVHIISNGYNFRFDQHYFTQLKQGKKAYPWPIIPVQNSDQDLLPELAVLIKKDWVTFVLQIRPDVDIINELQFLQTNSRLLLFLNRVSSIELVHETDEVKIDIQSDGEQDKKIFINGVFSSAWIIRKFVTRIPESINTFLNTLQDSECPQRLKSTMQTKITFAAQINAVNQIVVSTYNQLFCYLPTQINCGFACLVNGDFLLNTERTRLMDNQWNGFLLKRIGYFQIKFCIHSAIQQQSIYK